MLSMFLLPFANCKSRRDSFLRWLSCCVLIEFSLLREKSLVKLRYYGRLWRWLNKRLLFFLLIGISTMGSNLLKNFDSLEVNYLLLNIVSLLFIVDSHDCSELYFFKPKGKPISSKFVSCIS